MAEGKIFSEQRLHFWSVTESYHFALENLESSTSFVWTITSGQPIYKPRFVIGILFGVILF